MDAVEIPTGEELPEWLLVVPTGTFNDHPDGAHEITAEMLGEMLAAFEASSTDLLIDRDHASIFRGDTRAAGWSDALRVTDRGLEMRRPVFTEAAQAEIDAREYRYFSPAVDLVSKNRDGSPGGSRLLSVAITSFPYFDQGEIDAIGNSRGRTAPDPAPTQTPDAVDRDKLIQLYDLPEDATDDDIQAAVDAAIAAKAEAPGDTEPDDEPEGDEVAKLSARIKRLEKAGAEDRVETLVSSAVKRGALLPADVPVWKSHARADFDDAKRQLDARKDNSALPGKLETTEPDAKTRTSSDRHADAVAHIKAARSA